MVPLYRGCFRICKGMRLLIREIKDLAVEVANTGFCRAIVEVSFDLALQVSDKPGIAFVCYDREQIHALHQRLAAGFQIANTRFRGCAPKCRGDLERPARCGS